MLVFSKAIRHVSNETYWIFIYSKIHVSGQIWQKRLNA